MDDKRTITSENNIRESTELKSWITEWKIKTRYADIVRTYYESFVEMEEAEEFKIQLEKAAKLIKIKLYVSIYKKLNE